MGVIRTTTAPGVPAGFPFSLAGEAGNVCFISGMPALNSDGTLRRRNLSAGDRAGVAPHSGDR
jgi:enamine deaminase RidA (YjgF/YER057c/UK114 family)